MTELGVAEEYLATKVSEDVSKCIISCETIMHSFKEMSEIDFREAVVDADVKVLLTTFAPVIEQLAARLREAELIPMMGAKLLTLKGNNER